MVVSSETSKGLNIILVLKDNDKTVCERLKCQHGLKDEDIVGTSPYSKMSQGALTLPRFEGAFKQWICTFSTISN